MIKKRAQEEMVGFALIIILVSVILLAFLGFSLSKDRPEIKSYEVDNFIQAFLQYTTDCEEAKGYLDIQHLVFEGDSENTCSDGRKISEVLNNTLKGIIEESWPVEEGSSYQGYELLIYTEDLIILSIEKGNSTRSYKAGSQRFDKTRPKRTFIIDFKVYS